MALAISSAPKAKKAKDEHRPAWDDRCLYVLRVLFGSAKSQGARPSVRVLLRVAVVFRKSVHRMGATSRPSLVGGFHWARHHLNFNDDNAVF